MPLIQKTKTSVGIFCLSPCQSNDHFMLRNGSCREDCPRYFERTVQYGVKYCISPCLNDRYYYHQNKSCLDKCPYPLKITQEEGINLCQDPCSNSNDFIYDNQSCHQSCPLPLKTLRIEERNYCKSPCLTEYVNSDGSCQDNCTYPARIIEIGPYRICLKRTQEAQIVSMREIIKMSNRLSEIGGVLSCLMNIGGDSTSLLMVPLLDMFKKIIETDVVLPEKTKFILTIEIKKYNERFVMIGICSLIALFTSTLLKFTSPANESKLYQFVEKLDVALRWNTLIPLFICMIGDDKQFQLETPGGILCILLIIFIFRKIFKVSQRRGEEDNRRWRFMFEIFSENSRFFIFIFFLRVIMFDLVIGLLGNYPYFQSFSMILLSCGMCFYLVWLSPIKKTLSKIQYLTIEFALLLYNLIFGVLAVFDLSDGLMADILGQLMNILYLITSVITAVLIVLKIIHKIYKKYNSSSRNLQENQIQLSEVNQDSPIESVPFEALNQEEEEANFGDQNNFGKLLFSPEINLKF